MTKLGVGGGARSLRSGRGVESGFGARLIQLSFLLFCPGESIWVALVLLGLFLLLLLLGSIILGTNLSLSLPCDSGHCPETVISLQPSLTP